MKTLSTCLFALFLSTGSAMVLAGTPINETRDADADVRIDISNVQGSVKVTGWDRNQVTIGGVLGSGNKGLEVSGDESSLAIKVEASARSGWFNWGSGSDVEDSTLDIRVPVGAELSIETVSADITVDAVHGRMIHVDTVSGKTRLDSNAREIEIGSVSGNVNIVGQGERADVDSISGDIDIQSNHQDVQLETVAGSINARLGSYREFSASSVSGDISLRGKPGNGGRVDAETMSGDVTIMLPADASARLGAETFSGRIQSDFGTVSESRDGPGRSLTATVGSGDARVTLESFSGDLTIRRE